VKERFSRRNRRKTHPMGLSMGVCAGRSRGSSASGSPSPVAHARAGWSEESRVWMGTGMRGSAFVRSD
jgi:hypothetical protein